jgi:uncharacterized protein (TIGR03437 family)
VKIRPAIVLVLTITAAAQSLPSTVSIQSSTNPAIFGHAVTLTATVSPAAATGPVTFYEGASVVGAGSLYQGHAMLTTTLLPAGTGTFTAYYRGDNSYESGISPPVSLTVTALPGNGFQTLVNYPVATNSNFVAVGDFNGDGHEDLAIINAATTPSQVLILIGNGDGTFNTVSPPSFPVGNGANSIVVGDFNGDGIPDLAVANGADNTVSILMGVGSGFFQQAFNYPTGPSPDGIAVADFDGDGLADLAVATANGVSVLIGNGYGAFQAPLNTAAGLATSVAVANFKTDGRADVVLGTPDGIVVLIGAGDGTFQNNVTYPTGVGGGPVAIADFNGDGKLDIAATSGGLVSVALGNGDGTFQPAISSASGTGNASVQSLAVGDFNGDGHLDLATANYLGAASSTNVAILLGTGNGAFATPVYYPITAVTFAAAGDFNGDGVVDLVTAGLGPLGVMLGIPAAVVTPPPPPPPPPTPVVTITAVLDAAGYGNKVAPGSLVSIFGTFPGATQADFASLPFPVSLGQVTVTFSGIIAPIRDVIPASGQINVQVPFEAPLTPTQATTSNNVVVIANGIPSAAMAVPVAQQAPGIFTVPPNGLGNAVLVFVDPADGITKIAAPTAASATFGFPTAPIPRGTAGYFYATGLGVLSPPVADGDGGEEPPVVTHYAEPLNVLIGSVQTGAVPATEQFAGQAPGFPGVNQINIVIPAGAPTGDAVPIQLQVQGGFTTGPVSNVATIAIR